MSNVEEPVGESTGGAIPAPDVVVMDVGKHSDSRVSKLRKGRGKLLARIEAQIDGLKDEGLLVADAQTVIVVVERETRDLFDW